MRDILAEIRLRIENAKKSSIIRGPVAPSAVREKKSISLRDIAKIDADIARLDAEIRASREARHADDAERAASRTIAAPRVPRSLVLKRDYAMGDLTYADYFHSRLCDISARKGVEYARRVYKCFVRMGFGVPRHRHC